MRRSAIFLIAAALLYAGCGESETPFTAAQTTATEVIAQVESTVGTTLPPAPLAPEGCQIEIQRDEYGFETDVVICDQDPVDPEVAASIVGWVGSTEAIGLAGYLSDLMLLQSGCVGTDDLDQAEVLAASAPTELRERLLSALGHLRDSAENCNVEVSAWQSSLESALDDLEEVANLIEEARNA